jgi:hypothetical protein
MGSVTRFMVFAPSRMNWVEPALWHEQARPCGARLTASLPSRRYDGLG